MNGREVSEIFVDVIVTNPRRPDQITVVPNVVIDPQRKSALMPRTILESIGIRREKFSLPFNSGNSEIVTEDIGFAILQCG